MNNEEGKQNVFKIGEKEFEVFKEVKRKNYTIKFLKNENPEKNIDDLYRGIGELLFKHATSENKESPK